MVLGFKKNRQQHLEEELLAGGIGGILLPARARSVSKRLCTARVTTMLDVLYIATGVAFFVMLWAFTKAAERL